MGATMTAPSIRATEQFRAALLAGDVTALALVADRMRQDPRGAARWLRLARVGRPKDGAKRAQLLRQMRACPSFSGLSTHAAAKAIGEYLMRYAEAGWRFERDAQSNPNTTDDRRGLAWELGRIDAARFPPKPRTIRRALETVGQK